ncbi:MAG TPA: hypothetical protein VH561_13250 [Micromonosporaceae bacterium]|jgi:hypothetical protein
MTFTFVAVVPPITVLPAVESGMTATSSRFVAELEPAAASTPTTRKSVSSIEIV